MRQMLPILVVSAAIAAATMGAHAQQAETGPAASPKGQHPLNGSETGVRGPSNGAPETGPHGQRDVTKNAEPGKPPNKEEQRQTGQAPQSPPVKAN